MRGRRVAVLAGAVGVAIAVGAPSVAMGETGPTAGTGAESGDVETVARQSSHPVSAGYIVRTARYGELLAELTFRSGDELDTDMRLRISREGEVAFDGPVTHRAYERDRGPVYPAGGDIEGTDPVKAWNLDGRGAPEVIVDLYTGGAHCCTESLIYREISGAFRPKLHRWGNKGYKLTDLGRDGRKEFLSADDRFSYEFCFYAGSAAPIQIWRYRGDRMRDVTRAYPRRVRRSERALWREYLRMRTSKACSARARLAAWAASKFLLGEGDEAMARVERERMRGYLRPEADFDDWPANERYVSVLREFLRANGYNR